MPPFITMRNYLVAVFTGLFFLIGCTTSPSTTATFANEPPPLSVRTDGAQPQVVDGFDAYTFPTPENSAENATVTGQAAVGRVSQAALGAPLAVAAEVSDSVPVVSGLVDSATVAETLVSQGPITPVSAEIGINATTQRISQNALNGNPPLITMDRASFVENLRLYRDSLRELVYLADMAYANGTLDCISLNSHMAALDATPRTFEVARDLQLANYHLQLAFEQAETAFRPIATHCATHNSQLRLTDVQPSDTVMTIFPTAQYALHNVYDSVLWVTGNSDKVHELYLTTRQKIADYRTMLSSEAAGCAELKMQYESIVYSPQLSLPSGQVANTYAHYQTAINLVAEGGQALYHTCGAADQDVAMLKQETSTLTFESLNQIDIAITYLP